MRERRPHVLVAEFDPEILVSLERVLEDEGFDTATAWATAQALDLLETGHFDLLLLSDHPPQVNCGQLLTFVHDHDIPVSCVIMQSRERAPLPDAFLSMPGVNAIVSKWNQGEIIAGVRDCLNAAKPGTRRAVAASQ